MQFLLYHNYYSQIFLKNKRNFYLRFFQANNLITKIRDLMLICFQNQTYIKDS